MPLPGGPAEKIGNRYESSWTVLQLVRVLNGQFESIRIEVPGVDKAEFVLGVRGIREWHQAKRSHPSGQWTLSALAGSGEVLGGIATLLDGNADRFVFASASDARELAELADRARQAATVEEFQTLFLKAREHADRFARLCRAWSDCDAPTAYDRLQRTEVRTVDEHTIEELTRWGIAAIYLGDPQALINELRAVATNSIHVTITRDELIVKLATRGFAMRRVIDRTSAAATVADATRRFLEGVRGKLIRRTLVPREETQVLLDTMSSGASDVVLTGSAGSGKTACLIEFVETLKARGVPVLALRLDRIDPVSTAHELGLKAGLEESPALVLAAAAEGRSAVLVIDQLDAISTTSGRSTGFLDAVAGVLKETRGLRERTTIHVVVVCREFDWQNDHRLKTLLAEGHGHVSVSHFTIDRVQEILRTEGFDLTIFRPRQLALLCLPQNLSLFLEVQADRSNTPAFNTAADLFERYWDEKRRTVRQRAGGVGDRWMDVISILVDEVTRTQQLSVLRERLDVIDLAYLEQMSSEGVVTFDGRRYGFGHESFFDYCFARLFVTRQGTLVDHLVSAEQHLFRRSQVRQVLTYLRESNRGHYIRELRGLLTDGRVRGHVKDLAFALLSSVNDPGDDEWAIWEPLHRQMLAAIEAGDAKSVDVITALAWRHFFTSPSWFAFAVEKGLVSQWLAADARLADMAAQFLSNHQRHAADIVAELLEPYAEKCGAWPVRLRWVVEMSDLTGSRRFLELTLRLIDNGVLDEARGAVAVNSTFWSLFHGLGKGRPEWIPEVISHWLRRRIAKVLASDGMLTRTNLFAYDQFAQPPISTAAKNAPVEFVKHVLAVVLEICDLAVYHAAALPRRDTVWPILIKSDHPRAEDACLAGLATALGTLAGDGADMREVIDDLRHRDTYIANHLLQVLYTAGADRYADEAATMLVAEPWRLKCGYSDSPYWTATELVRAIVRRCGPDVRLKLEGVLISFRPPWERTPQGYKFAGSAAFSLLSTFPPDLRSPAGATRYGELERKFGAPAEPPRGIQGGWVRSPIDEDAATKMSDDQWISAIAKYDIDGRLAQAKDGFKGGASELAQTLETMVKQQPERFARLALRFPTTTNPLYLERTLAGLTQSSIEPELKLGVCRKAFREHREGCGRWIADVLGAFEDTLPDDAIDALVWLATKHPDPDHEAWRTDAGGGRTYYNGDIQFNGINTTRGRAANAMRDLIWRDAALVARFSDALDLMVADPSAAVRSCVAGVLRAVAYHDTTRALALFSRMHISDERLLGTAHVEEFIASLLRDHYDDLRATIARMLRSSESAVAQVGARLAGLAALYHDRAADLASKASEGTVSQRCGIAQVAAANIALQDCRAWCERHLSSFFNDASEEVRTQAAGSMRRLHSERLEHYEALLRSFTESASFADDSSSILHLLQESPRRLPGMTCIVCQKFLERFSDEARDFRTGRAGDAYTVTHLAFRTYHQHQDDEWTGPALDLIDRLSVEGIGDARKELDSFER
jgi:hypothetical protein